jgi:uncharacterized membrane protein
MSDGPSRRTYLDVLRGVAVLVMIEAHVLDSWTRFSDRQTRQFTDAIVIGGFGAPLFLFLAGVAVPLSAGSKFRRSGDVGAASRAVVRRGLEITGLAFVFRVQSWLLGRYPAWFMFRVDILNIMGPSIMAAAAIWGALRTARGRFVAFVAVTLAATLFAPFAGNASLLSSLPDPIEAYLRPLPGISNFVLLPWVGFLFAGVIVGLVLDSVRTRKEKHAVNLYFTLVGTALALTAHVLSFFPTWYPRSYYWTTSPAFFFLRLGIMTAAIGLAYAWELRPGAHRWSPLQQLGRTSLFIYWIHVEMVYGGISWPVRGRLSLPQVWVALALFCLFMLLCSILKDQVVARRTKAQGSGLKAQARSSTNNSKGLPEP